MLVLLYHHDKLSLSLARYLLRIKWRWKHHSYHLQITCKVSKGAGIWVSGRYTEIKAFGKKGRKHMGCRDHMGSGRDGRTAAPQMILRSNA